jgi:hypothetical protein
LKLARANGDTALEAQISAFLTDFQSRRAGSPMQGAKRNED